MGKNIKVLLYYLDLFAKEFNNLGIIIVIVGFITGLSISFTIVLVTIFNTTIKIINEDKNNNEDIKAKPQIFQNPQTENEKLYHRHNLLKPISKVQNIK